jgi:2'-5' RNA ligase
VTTSIVTGLVFDLPHEPWTMEVLRSRQRYDPHRLHFPVEITVVGSSGLGWFSPSQPIAHLVERVSTVARPFAPFACPFAGVEHFSDSNVYYLTLCDEAPFHSFQQLLAASGLSFEPTPFSYKPHCTIAALSPSAGDADHAALARFSVPQGSIAISSVSFYAIDSARNECRHLERIRLGG